jgi:hypothetical protein
VRPDTEYSEAMRLVASDAEREPAWYSYARYCRERERGLRKQALRHLETFVAGASGGRSRRDFPSLPGSVRTLSGRVGRAST